MTQVTSLENRIKFLQKMLVKSLSANEVPENSSVLEIRQALDSARRKRKSIKEQRKKVSEI